LLAKTMAIEPHRGKSGAYLAAMAFLSGQLRSIDRECLS